MFLRQVLILRTPKSKQGALKYPDPEPCLCAVRCKSAVRAVPVFSSMVRPTSAKTEVESEGSTQIATNKPKALKLGNCGCTSHQRQCGPCSRSTYLPRQCDPYMCFVGSGQHAARPASSAPAKATFAKAMAAKLSSGVSGEDLGSKVHDTHPDFVRSLVRMDVFLQHGLLGKHMPSVAPFFAQDESSRSIMVRPALELALLATRDFQTLTPAQAVAVMSHCRATGRLWCFHHL